MLKIAIENGYPAVRLWLRAHGGISSAEHRELLDFLSVDTVGGERLDWHFARLYQLLFALLGKPSDGEDPPELGEWLLEQLINPTEAELDEEEEYDRFVAVMRAFAATHGVEERVVALPTED
jgi:hypothetical protein